MTCRWVLALSSAGLLAIWPIAQAEPPTSAPASQPVGEVATPVFAVLDYFQQNCAGCHGPYGKYYLPKLGDRHPGEQLRAILKEMADGPAQAPLEAAQLDQLVKYHESLSAGEPYVAVSDREGTTLRGEVSPENQVIIEVGETRIEAEVTGHTWEANLPGNVDAGEINVRVKADSEKQQ